MVADTKWRMLTAIPALLLTMQAAAQGPAVSSLAPRVKAAMDQVAGAQEKGKRCMRADTTKEAERLVSYGRSVHGTMSTDNNTNPQIYAGTTAYVGRYEDEVRKFMADAKRQCPEK